MKNIAIITGASSGMGKEFALTAMDHGRFDEIWCIARNQKNLEDLIPQINTVVRPIPLDLTRRESFDTLKQELKKEDLIVSLLINASGFGIFESFENTSWDNIEGMIDLNVKALVRMTKVVLPYMSIGSRIINIASMAALQPVPYVDIYAATKAFVTSYGRALNEELKYRDIHVLTVTPFWTKTAFFDRAIDPKKKLVVLNYAAMYDPAKVMRQAVKDLFTKKEISCYGVVNQLQWVLVRLLPKKIVMKVWMKSQSLDGTPGMRP